MQKIMLPKNSTTSLNLAGVKKYMIKNMGKNLNKNVRLLNNTIYFPLWAAARQPHSALSESRLLISPTR